MNTTIRKVDYSKKSVANLLEIGKTHFNLFIRTRDKDKPCINCGRYKSDLQAGHFYSVGGYPGMRFDEDNVHGECLQCNFFHSETHSHYYREHLKKRIGTERFEKLCIRAEWQKHGHHKWDRFTLIQIIEKYKRLNKDK
jgi:hypothetical protein